MGMFSGNTFSEVCNGITATPKVYKSDEDELHRTIMVALIGVKGKVVFIPATWTTAKFL